MEKIRKYYLVEMSPWYCYFVQEKTKMMPLLTPKQHPYLGKMTSFGLTFEGNESTWATFDLVISNVLL
jgi:hypothetical protein